MTLSYFNSQPLSERKKLVLTRGSFLMLRKKKVSATALYNVHGFYAEVWYSTVENRVVMVNGFKSIRKLAPYLEQIDVRELIGEE